MNTLFIGGSRHMTAGMESAIRWRVEQARIAGEYIIVGDAAGVDYSVQQTCLIYEVICTVYGITQKPRYFAVEDMAFYRRVGQSFTERDRFLCIAAGSAYFVWNGQSSGTRANIARMKALNKPFEVWTPG